MFMSEDFFQDNECVFSSTEIPRIRDPGKSSDCAITSDGHMKYCLEYIAASFIAGLFLDLSLAISVKA